MTKTDQQILDTIKDTLEENGYLVIFVGSEMGVVVCIKDVNDEFDEIVYMKIVDGHLRMCHSDGDVALDLADPESIDNFVQGFA